MRAPARPFRLAALTACALALGACADWPSLATDAPAPRFERYPALLPIDGLLASAPPAGEQSPSASVEARAAALRARAAVLSQPAEDAAALEEMRRRLAEGPG